MNTQLLRLVISCFFSLFSIGILAQEPAYRNYTASDGLPSNNVYSVMQDSKGFIWFATDNGVSCFDGTRFKNYSITDGLSDNSILRIVEDAEGRLWFLTFNGKLSFYKNDKIYNSSNTELLRQLNFTAFITYFFQDSKKNIWITTNDNSLVRITPSGEIKSYKYTGKSFRIWEDRYGHVYNLSGDGIGLLSDTGMALTSIKCNFSAGINMPCDSLVLLGSKDCLILSTLTGKTNRLDSIKKYNITNVVSFSIDGKNMWLGTLNGAVEYINGIMSPRYEHAYLKNHQITSVFRDKDNNLWFTSVGEGVFMVPSVNIRLFDEKSGLINNYVSSFVTISDSVFMVGLNNGSIQIISHGKVQTTGQSLIKPGGAIIRISKGVDGIIWILTEYSVYKYYNSNFTLLNDSNTWYKSLFISRDGTPWIGWGRGLKKIHDGKIISVCRGHTNRVYAIQQLRNNDFLLGTDHGLYHYINNKIIEDRHRDSLLSHRISALAITADSTLWIATKGYGLLNLKNGVVKSYTIKDHMLSNRCNDLLADSNKIYLATDNGLNVLYEENNTVHIASYSIANGLVSNHINEIIKKNKYDFILATDRGIVEFDVRKLPLSSSGIPYINSIVVNDRVQPLISTYNFNHNENNIKIEYGDINFNSAGNTYYRYKLVGADVNWNYTTYSSVKYSYLRPGNYTFIVATQNADGSWNPKSASFTFNIQTPWWQTWWFRTAFGLSLIAVIYLITKWRISVYKQQVNRERALAQSELKALRAQINPHFIYNSLNAIQDFILQNQKEDANLYLSKFASLMRSILSHSRVSSVSLDEEIASLQLYLELEALRFNNKFTFQFIVDKNIDTEYVHIPSMILQPYIENAILHGLAPFATGGKISIGFCLKNNFLVSTIEDNGIGRKKADEARKQRVWKGHKSLGMTVTQERIDLMSSHQKEKINMEITDLVDDSNNPAGTRVTIYFPLQG